MIPSWRSPPQQGQGHQATCSTWSRRLAPTPPTSGCQSLSVSQTIPLLSDQTHNQIARHHTSSFCRPGPPHSTAPHRTSPASREVDPPLVGIISSGRTGPSLLPPARLSDPFRMLVHRTSSDLPHAKQLVDFSTCNKRENTARQDESAASAPSRDDWQAGAERAPAAATAGAKARQHRPPKPTLTHMPDTPDTPTTRENHTNSTTDVQR